MIKYRKLLKETSILLAVICALNPLTAMAGSWTYNEAKDEMRGTSTYSAELKSINVKEFSSPYDGGSSLTIMMVSQDDKNIVGIALILNNGRVACRSVDNCIISTKFDDGPIKEFSVSPAGRSGNALKVNDVPSFSGLLKGSKNVFVEVPVYQEGAVQFKFSPEPFKFDVPNK